MLNVFDSQVKAMGVVIMEASNVVLDSILGMFMATILACRTQVLAGAFFFSFLAIVWNFDVAVKRASRASDELTDADGELSSKVGSTCESYPVIRTCGVAPWAAKRLNMTLWLAARRSRRPSSRATRWRFATRSSVPCTPWGW